MNQPEVSLPERYSELEPIASGGMGSVFKARDTFLEIDVAIKFLSEDTSDPEFVKRFQTEAKVAGNLKHRNLVTIFDFGVTENNVPYLVMEFVDGETLKDYITRQGKLPIDIALGITQQITEAMIHAHQNGVIHRDLKSANVVLSKNETGEVFSKVIDFGIACRQEKDTEEGKLTRPGLILGSPLYMSPEQINNQEVDERSDVYSLGCILFECLTGRVPFKGETAIDTMNMHRSDPIPDLSEFLDKDIESSHIGVCVEKALAKTPEDRFQTMEEFHEQLSKAQASLVDQVDTSSASYNKERMILERKKQILKRSSRNVNLVSALLVALIVVVGTIALLLVLNLESVKRTNGDEDTFEKPVPEKVYSISRNSDKSIHELISLAKRDEKEMKYFRMANNLQIAHNRFPQHRLMKEQIRKNFRYIDKHFSQKIARKRIDEMTGVLNEDSKILGERGLLYLSVGEYKKAYSDLREYLKIMRDKGLEVQAIDYCYYIYPAGYFIGKEKESKEILSSWQQYSGRSNRVIFELLLGRMSDKDYFESTIKELEVAISQKEIPELKHRNICRKLTVGGYYLVCKGREKEAIDILLFPSFAADHGMAEKYLSIYELRRLWKKYYPLDK